MFIFYIHISNSVGSDSGGGDGAGGDDVMDMLYVLGNNALGSNDALDNDESDNNELEKPGNMDVSHHVVLHNYHVRNRIAYLFLLSISI